ncbi:MAG: DUF6473 family protein [Pseudopelagicola sp.]|nr:DUF6473 family protein [Pseudopelagicola sp.]
MSYEKNGGRALDYMPYRLGESRIAFRGPRPDLSGKPLVCLGGTETYGKYVERPFPTLLAEMTGVSCVNLGVMNAGVDVLLAEPSILELARRARLTVVQLPGAPNMSNRYYTVHPRRNDRFTGASQVMKMVFREIDFTEFHFTRHMLGALAARAPERYTILRTELQQAWLARMKTVIERIGGARVLLLWFADHALDTEDAPYGLGQDPLFVEHSMVDQLRPLVAGVVESVVSEEALARGTEGMVCNDLERPVAQRLFGPAAHKEAARAVADWIKRHEI